MRILLAVDGSPYSEEAIHSITSRPWPKGTQVRVLHSIPIVAILPPVGDFTGTAAQVLTVDADANKEAQTLVASVAAQLRTAGLDADTVITEGDARSAIVDGAKEWSADLIVMGSHGYTGITRWLLGSVAQSVVAHAPCSVEVVRKESPKAS